MRGSLLKDRLYRGDCLRVLDKVEARSVDMVLVDLPYGRTARNAWDNVISMEALWPKYKRICKPGAPIVFTAVQPFASMLVMSNPKWFRYDWIWRKNKTTGFLNAKKAPLRAHEHVLVFCEKGAPYFPQKTKGHKPVNSFTKHTSDGTNYGKTKRGVRGGGQTDRYPVTVLDFPVVNNDDPEHIHPTQKPVPLFKYLILTYTKPGALVLDHCVGSGTTAIAAQECGRHFIGIDLDVSGARKRLAAHRKRQKKDHREC